MESELCWYTEFVKVKKRSAPRMGGYLGFVEQAQLPAMVSVNVSL